MDSGAGSRHRNHCPFCLWSLHLDLKKPGDRMATCSGGMKPVGLSFKSEGGKKRGELCVMHRCQKCGVKAKNRLAADDDPIKALEAFKGSWDDSRVEMTAEQEDSVEVVSQLFGRPNLEKYLFLLKD